MFLAGEVQKILNLPIIAPLAPKRVWIYVKVPAHTPPLHQCPLSLCSSTRLLCRRNVPSPRTP